jgi:hypothetical protein
VINPWWRRQFTRLLDQEKSGADPNSLASRWLVLLLMASGKRRNTVSFEIPDQIRHILDDADVRAKDRQYAEGQWRIAEKWLNA